MKNFAVPSLLYIAIVLVLPPMLIQWIEQWFPTNTYWWSALIVVILNAIVLVVKIAWSQQAAEAESVAPVGTLSAPTGASVYRLESKKSVPARFIIFGA